MQNFGMMSGETRGLASGRRRLPGLTKQATSKHLKTSERIEDAILFI